MAATRTLAMLMAVPALAQQCAPGYKPKENAANEFCNDASDTAASCNAHCCTKDTTTCGGLAADGSKCDSDQYHGFSDAWKSVPSTKKTFATDCCNPKVTCSNSGFTCPAGTKRKSGVANTQCPGDAASCAIGNLCCKNDATTCGGYNANTPATVCFTSGTAAQSPKFPALVTDAILSDDGWKAIKIGTAGATPAARYQASCCVQKTECTSKGYSCPAGQRKKSTLTGVFCQGKNSDSKDIYDSCASACCEADTGASTKTCSTNSIACPANQYYPGAAPFNDNSWKNKYAIQSTLTASCCTAKATCADVTCPAGSKMKAHVAQLSCPGDKDSCATSGPCCEPDTATCGGQVGILCGYGTFNEATTWTAKTTKTVKDAWKSKPATVASKNTACCTGQSTCGTGVTTTPAAVATVTPAAPARLFAKHQAAVKAAEASHMVWLGVGALAGMAVLMGIQHARAPEVSYRTVM